VVLLVVVFLVVFLAVVLLVSLLLRYPYVEPMNHTNVSAPSPAGHRQCPSRKPLSGRTNGVTSSVLRRGGGRVGGTTSSQVLVLYIGVS
jgi:hypothetical protein